MEKSKEQLLEEAYRHWICYDMWDNECWIVNSKKRIAYETTIKKNLPHKMITHDMSQWHSTSMLEIQRDSLLHVLPDRFTEMEEIFLPTN